MFHFLQSTFVYGMKLNLTTNLVLNYVSIILSFPECFQPINIIVMCIVVIKFIEPSEFIVESQYFIPLLNKISWFVNNIKWGVQLRPNKA